MIRSFCLGLLTLSLLSTLASAASPGENLNRLLGGFDSFSSDFEQLVLDASGTRLQQSHGQVELKRPGKFRWRTDEPFPQLLVSDGEQLWLYDQDLEQVTQQKVDGRLTNTPALLLSGDLSTLEQSFLIDGPGEGDSGIYRLLPRDENALFVVMRMLFEAGQPLEMQLEDNLGQRTSVQFQNIQINPPLESSRFQFVVPDGVDLIKE